LEAISKRTYRLIIGATLLSTFTFAQIEKDKQLHFAAGLLTGYVGEKLFDTPESPIISAFAVGLGKEIYDEISYGGFDDFDLFATTLGGIVIYLVNKPKKNKLTNKILYAKTDYTFYDTYYELDLYTSYNTRQAKESKKE
tara:strand:- start:1109 stop:1528 length:420 start_codon:yes stop_codon:yes gene_type:complete